LLRKIEEFDKCVAIAGFKNVKITDINELLRRVRKKLKYVHAQFFDARLVASKDHLYFAALNALKAFENGTNRSRDMAIEALLYATAQRQIRNAVDIIGITQNSNDVAVLTITETEQQAYDALETISELLSGSRDDAVLKMTEEKFDDIKRLFRISDRELEANLVGEGFEKKALIDLVLEHVALLATDH